LVPSRQLTVSQSALLIGMLKATYYYNPRKFEERSLRRRNVVLGQMAKYDMLDQEEYEALVVEPVGLKYKHISHNAGLAPYFREHLRQELLQWCEEQNKTRERPLNLYTSGLKIYTTLDSRLQEYAEAAVRAQMAIIQKNFRATGDAKAQLSQDPDLVKEALRRSPHYNELVASGMSNDSIDIVLRQPVRMSVFSWDGEKEVIMSPMDSVAYYLTFLNAGVLAMDPANGAIRAWVGGIEHKFFQYDHVREGTRRQVGSTFKPIVYAAALEQGVKPCTYI
jgi:penicillin-binding protein 1A